MTYTIKEFIEKLKLYDENEKVCFDVYEISQDKIEVKMPIEFNKTTCETKDKRVFEMNYTVKELLEKLKLFEEDEEIYSDAYRIDKNKIEVEILIGFEENVYETIEKRG